MYNENLMILISEDIIKRLKKNNVSFKANDNISKWISTEEKELLKREVEYRVDQLLRSLIIDTDNDHNTEGTAKRVAKMYMDEIFSGRYNDRPEITSFPNAKQYDQLYITGPIAVRSTCSHHMQNIFGKCFIGVFPGNRVIGLSKFNRLVDYVCSRPQIQEEMTEQIADLLMTVTEAQGVAVVIKAEHYCMKMRGVKEHESDFTTSVMRGVFRDNKDIKNEFLTLLNGMKQYGE